LPEQAHRHRPAKRGGHTDEDMHGNAVGATTLDATNDTARHPNRIGKALLRPPASTTQRPHPESEPHDIHLCGVSR
jgi:hypothetical protein